MTYNEEVFNRQYPTVVFFVQHLAYYKGLKIASDRITDHKVFWASTTDSHLKLATIAWCNVFGSHKEDMHWTKTLAGKTVQQAYDDFYFRVLAKTGFSQPEWEDYHRAMLTFRDKYVAHVDLQNLFKGPVPHFDPALLVAYTYRNGPDSSSTQS
jgi:hypothetical protein